MHKTVTAITVGCVAAVLFAAPQPASATTTAAGVQYGKTDTGMIHEIARKAKKWKHRDRDVYVHGYSRRYPRYAYDYNYDYDYYAYRRRPGVNLYLDF